jgi:hypothetical protein
VFPEPGPLHLPYREVASPQPELLVFLRSQHAGRPHALLEPLIQPATPSPPNSNPAALGATPTAAGTSECRQARWLSLLGHDRSIV